MDDLKNRGFVTLAADVSQIVMVTTPNSLKYLKFAGKLSEKNIRKWADSASTTFGTIKWDKSTRFFHRTMVQSSYQLLNTLGLDKAQVQELLQPSFDYIAAIRRDIDFMRYHFFKIYKKENTAEERDADEEQESLLERADVIFKLMYSLFFESTTLYANFCNAVLKRQKKRLKEGRKIPEGTEVHRRDGKDCVYALSDNASA